MAGQHRIGHAREHAFDDAIAQARLTRRLRGPARGRDAHRGAESHDSGDVLGAGAAALLLTAAGLERRDARTAPDVQRTNALRPIELVRVDRDEIHRRLADVELEGADALHGIAVERDAALAAKRADLRDRL